MMDGNPGEALKSVKEQLLQIPRHGIGYGILRYLSGTAALREQAEPPMIFNYLGQFDHVIAGSELFRFARESSGPWHSAKQHRRFPLEINSMVLGGRLEMSWTYSKDCPPKVPVERLAGEFAGALRELIVHCCSRKTRERTPSDYPLAKLDQADLDRLFTRFSDVEDIYPLSPIQTLFFAVNSEASSTAFDQWYCTVNGKLRRKRLSARVAGNVASASGAALDSSGRRIARTCANRTPGCPSALAGRRLA